MPAKKIVSDTQMLLLLDYMEVHRDLAVGRVANSGPLEKQEVARKWEELAAALNAVGVGATKTGAKWRDYWAEKKYQVRKKAADLRVHALGTGGGPPKKKLTDIEERIVAILGKVAVEGQDCVRIPFPLSQDSAMPSCSAQASFSHSIDSSMPTPPAIVPPAPTIPSSLPLPRGLSEVPRWALEVENRRMETADLHARAIESMANTMATMQNNIAETSAAILRSLQNIENLLSIIAAGQGRNT